MKNRLIELALLLPIAASFLLPIQANASIVHTIKSEQASGRNATKQTIKVWNGHGVSISFYDSGEVIKKIWLDDPSKFIVDVDGCLQGMKDCGDSVGAGLIHLRKINIVTIRGLPQASSYGAHLTVVTQSNTGKKVYHFSIVPGTGTPQYSRIEIIDSQPKVAAVPQPAAAKPVNYIAIDDSQYIAKGMEIAVSNKWLATNSPLWNRLNKVVLLRSQGQDLRLAAMNAKVSMKLINKLMQMGSVDRTLPYTREVRIQSNY